jgi:hypothetical protein
LRTVDLENSGNSGPVHGSRGARRAARDLAVRRDCTCEAICGVRGRPRVGRTSQADRLAGAPSAMRMPAWRLLVRSSASCRKDHARLDRLRAPDPTSRPRWRGNLVLALVLVSAGVMLARGASWSGGARAARATRTLRRLEPAAGQCWPARVRAKIRSPTKSVKRRVWARVHATSIDGTHQRGSPAALLDLWVRQV